MTDEPSQLISAAALTLVVNMVCRSGPRSRATIVVTILVMLAGGWRENASWAYRRLPEASSTMATCGAETCGGASVVSGCGPPADAVGCVTLSGGVICT